MQGGFIQFSLPNTTDWYSGLLRSPLEGEAPNIWIQPGSGTPQGLMFEEGRNPAGAIDDFERQRESNALTKKEYVSLVKSAVRACQTQLEKVVLSRSVSENANTLNWKSWLSNLRANLPEAFIYFLHTDTHGAWMGATPEILITHQDDRFHTMALAGTKWLDDAFGEKEFIEQQAVTKSILDDLGLNYSAAGKREERAFGSIRHLCTPISFTSNKAILDLCQMLHPTPAVSGLPKKIASAFIAEHEQHDRELYTGYLLLDLPGISRAAFVNLRCMRLFDQRIQFFVGGGINNLSVAEVEGEETERKLEAVKTAMKFDE